jgi:hypothetical protein
MADDKDALQKQADAHLDGLIAAKGLEITTGALQVIIAIASVTTTVTVNTKVKPPQITPPNLSSLTFAQVGLDDEGVAVFKHNLKILLDFIATEIDKLPDNKNVNIGKVMEFIRLSILAAG